MISIDTLIVGLYLVGIFTALVVAHEWGHMWVAKRFGMRVEEFSVGIGPLLAQLWRDRTGTVYTVRWLPLGGFVRIAGMMPDEEAVPGSFQSKPLHARFLTVLAGPVASVLFGFILLVLIGLTAGLPTGEPTPQVRFVQPDSPAQQVGIRIGDVLLAIDGKPVKTIEDASKTIRASANKPITLTLRRGGETLTLTVTPRLEEERDEKGNVQKIGRIGVVWRTERRPQPLGTVIGHAARLSVGIVFGIADSLYRLVSGKGNIHEVGSIISIASATSAAAQLGFVEVADFAAMFSIMLGVVNLLPIPILDGGYLLIFTIEALRRRKLSPEAMARVQIAGLVIVLAIFITVFSLDIYKLVTGKLIR